MYPDYGDWIYGDLIRVEKDTASISSDDGHGWYGNYRVIPDTVGQYTGLTDKNGVRIFEGDIVSYNGTVHKVVFEDRGYSGYFGIVMGDNETWAFGMSVPPNMMEVVGNIHDNPDMMGGWEEARRNVAAKSKYRAVKTARVLPNGEARTFDSKREAERYDQLLLMQKAGKIRNLKLQPEFTLQEGFVDAQTGERVKPIVYKADFMYEVNTGDALHWQRSIEDAKGVRTKEYLLKRKMMLERGFHIVEV